MTPLISRYIHAVFCDDVRMEIGGKLTFVGIYQGTMNIQTDEMPAVVPKLCIAVSAHTPMNDLFTRLRFRVMKDDALLAESEASPDQLKPPTEESGAKYRTLGTVFTISPFVVEQDCVLRVFADTESDEFVSLGLRVKVDLDS